MNSNNDLNLTVRDPYRMILFNNYDDGVYIVTARYWSRPLCKLENTTLKGVKTSNNLIFQQFFIALSPFQNFIF